jgi:hypothetical protein
VRVANGHAGTARGRGWALRLGLLGQSQADLWADPKLYPVKSHLVLLRPQPRLKYLFSGRSCVAWFQSVFPRQDAVALGGIYDTLKTKIRAKTPATSCWLSGRAYSMATC